MWLRVDDAEKVIKNYKLNVEREISLDKRLECTKLLTFAMSKRSDLSFIRENAGRTVSINHEREKVEIDLISKCLRKSDFERIAAYLAVTYTDNTTGLIFAEVTDPDINEPSGEIINAIVQTGEFAIFTVSWC